MGNCYCHNVQVEKEVQTSDLHRKTLFKTPSPNQRPSTSEEVTALISRLKENSQDSPNIRKLEEAVSEFKLLEDQLKQIYGEDLPEEWPRCSDVSFLCEVAESEVERQLNSLSSEISNLLQQVYETNNTKF